MSAVVGSENESWSFAIWETGPEAGFQTASARRLVLQSISNKQGDLFRGTMGGCCGEMLSLDQVYHMS